MMERACIRVETWPRVPSMDYCDPGFIRRPSRTSTAGLPRPGKLTSQMQPDDKAALRGLRESDSGLWQSCWVWTEMRRCT